MWWKRYLVPFLCGACISAIFYVQSLGWQQINVENQLIPTAQPVQAQNVPKQRTVNKPRITILFWNSFFHWTFYGMGVGNRGFAKIGCKYTNCYTTTDHNKLNNLKVRVDAVVVHSYDSMLEENLKNQVSI